MERHHPRDSRRAGRNIAAITYYFRFERRFVPRLRPVDCRFYWRAVPSARRRAERLFAQPQPDRAAIRETDPSRLQEYD